MGMESDHWIVEYEGHKIEVEAYLAGFFTAGCSLFVDDKRVDSVPNFKSTFSSFSLRHILKDEGTEKVIRIQIAQRLIRTEAVLSIDGTIIEMNKTK